MTIGSVDGPPFERAIDHYMHVTGENPVTSPNEGDSTSNRSASSAPEKPTDALKSEEGLGLRGSIPIMRHGETIENKDNTAHGWSDEPLIPEGRKEVEKTANTLAVSNPPSLIAHSDLKRAAESARIVADKTGAKTLAIPELRTWDIGDFAGKECGECEKELKPYIDNPNKQVPGGESFNAFKGRVMQGLSKAAAAGADMIVTHNKTERMIDAMEHSENPHEVFDHNGGPEPGQVRQLKFKDSSDTSKDTIGDTVSRLFTGYDWSDTQHIFRNPWTPYRKLFPRPAEEPSVSGQAGGGAGGQLTAEGGVRQRAGEMVSHMREPIDQTELASNLLLSTFGSSVSRELGSDMAKELLSKPVAKMTDEEFMKFAHSIKEHFNPGPKPIPPQFESGGWSNFKLPELPSKSEVDFLASAWETETGKRALQNKLEENPYTQTTYHGTQSWEDDFRKLAASYRIPFYSSDSPELANLYAGSPTKVAKGYAPKNPEAEFGPYGTATPSSVVPLKLDVSQYHTVDAKGATWDGLGGVRMREGIQRAEEAGLKGLVVKNIYDEPSGSSRELGSPKNVYLTFDPATVRSVFAKFDPTKWSLNDLLASGVITGIAIKGSEEKE